MIAQRTKSHHFVYPLFWLLPLISARALAAEWTTPEQIDATSSQFGAPLTAPDTPIRPVNGIVNFWATWCAPCVKELPDLLELERALDEGQTLWLVNVGETAAQITEFADRHPDIQWRPEQVTTGFSFADMRAIGLRGLPTTFLVRDGKLIARVDGVREWADAAEQAWIKEQLAAPQ